MPPPKPQGMPCESNVKQASKQIHTGRQIDRYGKTDRRTDILAGRLAERQTGHRTAVVT